MDLLSRVSLVPLAPIACPSCFDAQDRLFYNLYSGVPLPTLQYSPTTNVPYIGTGGMGQEPSAMAIE